MTAVGSSRSALECGSAAFRTVRAEPKAAEDCRTPRHGGGSTAHEKARRSFRKIKQLESPGEKESAWPRNPNPTPATTRMSCEAELSRRRRLRLRLATTRT